MCDTFPCGILERPKDITRSVPVASLRVPDQLLPILSLLEGLRVSKDPQRRFGPRETNVHTPDVRHETDAARRTRSHAREYDDVALSSLEGVGSVEIDFLGDALAVLFGEPLSEQVELGLVWGDDADLARSIGVLGAQGLVELHSNLQLLYVHERPPALTLFLESLDVEEAIRPKQRVAVPRLIAKSRHICSVHQTLLVEHLAWEGADFRMHAVLGIKEVHRIRMILLHPDEEALIVAVLGRRLRQDGGGQLFRITDEHALGTSVPVSKSVLKCQ